MNKEKIKNFLQNCTERQFRVANLGQHQDSFDIYTLDFYDCNMQFCQLNCVMVYNDNIKYRRLVKDVIIASEEDERKFLFEGYGLKYFYCTPEYGKYLFDKYRLNEEIVPAGLMEYEHKLFKENKLITRYLEKRRCTFVDMEKYKNIFIDINNFPIIITEVKGND